jgi:hypothetical protein
MLIVYMLSVVAPISYVPKMFYEIYTSDQFHKLFTVQLAL